MLVGANINGIAVDGWSGFGLLSKVVGMDGFKLFSRRYYRDDTMTRDEVEVIIGTDWGCCALAPKCLYTVAIESLPVCRIHCGENTARPNEVDDAIVEKRRGNFRDIAVCRPACVGLCNIS